MQRGRKMNRLLDFWAGIPVLNLAATLRWRRKRPSSAPGKIAVMCSPALGDTLLFSAALQDVRAAFPQAEIVHVCMAPNRGAAAIIPGADRQVIINLTRPDHAIKLLRPERFDLFLDYTSWQRLTAFITLFSGARFTVGFTTPGMRRGRGYDLSVPHRDDLHEVDNFRAITRAIGVPATHQPALISLPPQDLTTVWPVALDRPVILFHLWPSGQKSWLREWPEDRWLQLAIDLHTQLPNAVFALSGTPAELPRTEPFAARLHAVGIEAHPLLASFTQLAAFLQRVTLTVSVNTGVMHLSAIAGAPTVSINGPNRNGRWGPVGPRAFGVESPGEGCGYLHLGFDSDGKATDCMERITVAHVLAASELVLAREPAHAGNA